MSMLEERFNNLSEKKKELFLRLYGDIAVHNLDLVEPRGCPSQEVVCSAQTARLWGKYKENSNNTAANMYACLSLKGSLNVAALEQALIEVAKRHEILRTNFFENRGYPSMRIHNDVTHMMQYHDLSAWDEETQLSKVRGIAEISKPFHLEAEPLLRFQLFKISDHLHYLVLVIHHIISDGWSMGVFFQEWAQYYNALTVNTPLELPTLTIQYADYAEWQKKWLESDRKQSEIEYWDRNLSCLPEQLPLHERSEGGGTEFVHRWIPVCLSSELGNSVKRWSAKEGHTLFVTFASIFGMTLTKISGIHDIILGTPVAGRNKHELESLQGMFVNIVPIRIRVDTMSSLSEVARAVHIDAANAFLNQNVPGDELSRHVLSNQGRSGSLFNAIIALQNAPGSSSSFQGIEIGPIRLNEKAPPIPFILEFYSPCDSYLDISLVLSERPTGFIGELEYNGAVIDDTIANQVLSEFTKRIDMLSKL